MKTWQFPCLMTVIIAITVSIASAEPRTWTDTSGNFKLEAQFVSLKDGTVTLRNASGKTNALPLAKLSEADRGHVLLLAAFTSEQLAACDKAFAQLEKVNAVLNTVQSEESIASAAEKLKALPRIAAINFRAFSERGMEAFIKLHQSDMALFADMMAKAFEIEGADKHLSPILVPLCIRPLGMVITEASESAESSAIGFKDIQTTPKPRTFSKSIQELQITLQSPGDVGKMEAYEALGKLYLQSSDKAKREEGVELLMRLKGAGDPVAWDEALAAIARHYSETEQWAKAEQEWFNYVADKDTSRFSAEAWYQLGYAREMLAGDDHEKLNQAVLAYFRCFSKYEHFVRFACPSWRRAAEIQLMSGDKEKAIGLLNIMREKMGEIAAITKPAELTNDVKIAQKEIAKAKVLAKKWTSNPDDR